MCCQWTCLFGKSKARKRCTWWRKRCKWWRKSCKWWRKSCKWWRKSCKWWLLWTESSKKKLLLQWKWYPIRNNQQTQSQIEENPAEAAYHRDISCSIQTSSVVNEQYQCQQKASSYQTSCVDIIHCWDYIHKDNCFIITDAFAMRGFKWMCLFLYVPMFFSKYTTKFENDL